MRGTSLVVQWLEFHFPNAGGPDSFLGQGTRFHMPQLRPKVSCAASKTGYSQINKINIKKSNPNLSKTCQKRMPIIDFLLGVVEAQSLSISSQDVCVRAC